MTRMKGIQLAACLIAIATGGLLNSNLNQQHVIAIGGDVQNHTQPDLNRYSEGPGLAVAENFPLRQLMSLQTFMPPLEQVPGFAEWVTAHGYSHDFNNCADRVLLCQQKDSPCAGPGATVAYSSVISLERWNQVQEMINSFGRIYYSVRVRMEDVHIANFVIKDVVRRTANQAVFGCPKKGILLVATPLPVATTQFALSNRAGSFPALQSLTRWPALRVSTRASLNMSETRYPLRPTLVFWVLSLIPDNRVRYVGLGLVSALLVISAIHLQHPSKRLEQLEDAITTTEESLERAKLNCGRNYLELAEEGCRLLQEKTVASKIQTCILQSRSMSWIEYLQASRRIFWNIKSCELEVRAIQTAALASLHAPIHL
ncbi:hypothetical protein B0H17DRAFT_1128180 [Mycena rosella]|uniref:Uncharacterized protein n=1 Tax=Mycena rosella TaxID=1033263 RepID=A0AAD7GM05_MYCRO|nr:hypothetical protein B0H17DRAFT_1128180 [Mycena rosella]